MGSVRRDSLHRTRMETVKIKLACCLILFGLSLPGVLSAQVPVLPPPGSSPAAQTAPQPPTGSEPVIRTIQIAFPTQGNVPSIEPQTYLYYIQTRPSRPSEDVWLLYDEELLLDDFRNLWATGFLMICRLILEMNRFLMG